MKQTIRGAKSKPVDWVNLSDKDLNGLYIGLVSDLMVSTKRLLLSILNQLIATEIITIIIAKSKIAFTIYARALKISAKIQALLKQINKFIVAI